MINVTKCFCILQSVNEEVKPDTTVKPDENVSKAL